MVICICNSTVVGDGSPNMLVEAWRQVRSASESVIRGDRFFIHSFRGWRTSAYVGVGKAKTGLVYTVDFCSTFVYGGASTTSGCSLAFKVTNLYAVCAGKFRSAGRQYDEKLQSWIRNAEAAYTWYMLLLMRLYSRSLCCLFASKFELGSRGFPSLPTDSGGSWKSWSMRDRRSSRLDRTR